MIVAVREGQVAETGTHDELMALDGLYSSLVKLQVSYTSIRLREAITRCIYEPLSLCWPMTLHRILSGTKSNPDNFISVIMVSIVDVYMRLGRKLLRPV